MYIFTGLPQPVPVRVSPDDLAALGEQLFGSRWQTPLVAALSTVTGRKVAQSTLAQWLLPPDNPGARPTPGWVAPALVELARQGARDLSDRQAAVEVWQRRVEAQVAAATPPTPAALTPQAYVRRNRMPRVVPDPFDACMEEARADSAEAMGLGPDKGD